MVQEWKEVIADWCGGMGFSGTNLNGGMVQMGVVDDRPGVSPMEMMLLGVAGCTGVDIVNILGKKRQKLHAFQVRVRGLRADEHPKVYTDIEIAYHLWGEDIDPGALEQAIELSEEKYCSASAMLKPKARITSQYVIHQPGEEIE